MTKKEEVGMVVVVLLLLGATANFAYGMGTYWGKYHALETCQEETK